MFYFIFFAVFSMALLIANIICFIKKKYLYLFIPCMLFLPEYYGIEFNSSLPLLTVARMMFIIFYIYAYINRRNNLNIRNIKIKELSAPYLLIGGYFIFRLVSNLRYIFTYGFAAKAIFQIIFEQLLFLIAMYMLAPTKNEINTLIKVIVYTATAFFIIGVFESFSSIRPFDSLYTVHRNIINEHYIRLGLYRATTTFGMPGMYANMCILVLPLIIYLYHMYHQKRYLVSIWLCMLALIHSGSRADYFYVPFILLLYLIFYHKDKIRIRSLLKNTVVIALALLLFMSISSSLNQYQKYYYIGTGKSILNEVGFDFDLSEGAPEGVDGYGGNDKAAGPNQGGVGSRKIQLTSIPYTLNNSPIFGFGAGALERKELKCYANNTWQPYPAIDVGLVEVITYEGILGLIGVSMLLAALFIMAKGNRTHVMLGIVYLLTTLNTVNMYSFLFLFVAIFMMDYKERASL